MIALKLLVSFWSFD